MGYGYENMAEISGSSGQLLFMGIENIHIMRKSFNKLRDLCIERFVTFVLNKFTGVPSYKFFLGGGDLFVSHACA